MRLYFYISVFSEGCSKQRLWINKENIPPGEPGGYFPV